MSRKWKHKEGRRTLLELNPTNHPVAGLCFRFRIHVRIRVELELDTKSYHGKLSLYYLYTCTLACNTTEPDRNINTSTGATRSCCNQNRVPCVVLFVCMC